MVNKWKATHGLIRVTFALPAEEPAQQAAVCGEFNDWSPAAHPMKRRADGGFSVTIPLEQGRSYRYRYVLDDGRWINDWASDDSIPNPYGGDDSVVHLWEQVRSAGSSIVAVVRRSR